MFDDSCYHQFISFLTAFPESDGTDPSSEEAKVLVDDTIQALKSNDTSRAQIHLNILKQELPTFVNSLHLD